MRPTMKLITFFLGMVTTPYLTCGKPLLEVEVIPC